MISRSVKRRKYSKFNVFSKTARHPKKSGLRNDGKKQKNLLDKLRKYILRYDLSKKQIGYGYIAKENLANKFNARIKDVEQCLHMLNLEGIVSTAHHTIDMDGDWQQDYYEVYKNDMPINPLTTKFGQWDIDMIKMDYNDRTTHNFLRILFNEEYTYIIQYQELAEHWDRFDVQKRRFLLNQFVLPSCIICAHFLHICRDITEKERSKILSRIASHEDISYWALFNCELSAKERIKLITVSANHKRYIKLAKYLKDRLERDTLIYNICESLEFVEELQSSKLPEYLDDDDKTIIAIRIGEIADAKFATAIHDILHFNDTQQDYIAHLVLAYKMSKI